MVSSSNEELKSFYAVKDCKLYVGTLPEGVFPDNPLKYAAELQSHVHVCCNSDYFHVNGRYYKVEYPFLISPDVIKYPDSFPFLTIVLPHDFTFSSVDEALQAFSQGQFILVLDDEERENEGDLIIAAEDIDEARMSFLIRNSTGIICTPMLKEDLERLEIPLMVRNNTDKQTTAFTISVDAATGVSTGVSAADRSHTCNLLALSKTKAIDFTRPGHIFPLQACDGGLLQRRGHTETAIELCKLTGKTPVGVIGEVIKDDGKMARRDDLLLFAYRHNLKIITVEQIVKYISK